MGNANTLKEFVSWGMSEYPAEKTGLIFWNHGGAMVGVCFDEKNNSDSLTAAEVKTALSGAGLGGSNKLEFIGYDACLMGVADIASVNSDFARYMIASEESEGGSGWDYDNWLPTLYSNPDDSLAIFQKICTTFIKDSASDRFYDSTLAAYDLSKMDTFISEFDKFTGTLSSSNWSSIKSCYSSALKFGMESGKSYYSIADAQSMITKMASSLNKDATNVLKALNDVVVVNEYGTYYKSSNTPCGICLFFAGDGNNYAQTSKSDYTANDTKFSNWRTFNINNGTFYS